MTTQSTFQHQWAIHFPDAIPVGYLLRHLYPHRWLRIHSLPKSKRYASSARDWQILLNRQNKIITDLFDNHTAIFLVTGSILHHDEGANCTETQTSSLDNYNNWIELAPIDLQGYDNTNWEGALFKPSFTKTEWNPRQHDQLLIDIANFVEYAFFVSFEKKRIVAPYDGGIDLILEDTLTRDSFKTKYRRWLSTHPTGL